MKALTFDGTAPLLRDVPIPEPGLGEALVRISLAGICNTDLEIVRGYMGFEGILGHEMVGVVEAHPDPSMVGRRVTSEINLACGECERCAAGLGRHCATRTVLGILGKDGCFAEYVTLPTENLHLVPDGVSDEAAVFTEPLAAAFEIVEQLRFAPGTSVLVLGDGKLGLLCTWVLAAQGLEVTVSGHHPEKLALVADVAATCTSPPDRLFEVVVEATGSPAGLEMALARVVPRGRIVLKSTFHGAIELDTAKVVIDELTVVGSRCGSFAPAISAIESATIDPTRLLTRTYPIEEGIQAFEQARTRGSLKILLKT